MNFKIFSGIEKITAKEWSEFVLENENGNIFQTGQIYKLYSAYDNYTPLLFYARDIKGKLLGILFGTIQRHTRFMNSFSSRAVISGAPLVRRDSVEVAERLLSEFSEYVSGNSVYTEIRNIFDVSGLNDAFISAGYEFQDHLNYIVNLKLSEAELWKNVHSKRRNEIRRAIKENVKVKEIDYDKELFQSFKIISKVYRNIRLPLPDYDYFTKAVEIMQGLGMMRVFAANYKSDIIAVMMVLCYKGTVYNWYAGGNPDYYRLYPNDILPWEVMLWSKNNGYEIFDYGGAGSPKISYGVREYKKKFGGAEKNYGRYIRINKPLTMSISKYGFRAWQFLKGKKS